LNITVPCCTFHAELITARTNVRFGSWIQLIDATTEDCFGSKGVANDTQNTHPVHGKQKGRDVGSLATGESLYWVAQHFDRHHSSVRGIPVESGGIRPPQRRRSPRVLSLAEREEISRGMWLNDRSVRLQPHSGARHRR
jgi:hypothetical protein